MNLKSFIVSFELGYELDLLVFLRSSMSVDEIRKLANFAIEMQFEFEPAFFSQLHILYIEEQASLTDAYDCCSFLYCDFVCTLDAQFPPLVEHLQHFPDCFTTLCTLLDTSDLV